MVSSKEAVKIIVEELNRIQNQKEGDDGAGDSVREDEDVHASRKEERGRS